MAPSATTLALAAAALVPGAVEAIAGAGHAKVEGTLAAVEMHMFRSDCGALRAGRTHAKIPGAGMDPDSLTPFDTVLKDGYYSVDCVKDRMFQHGDKFHDNKHEYEISTNVSIVFYDSHVAKEDREQMTHGVCFEFCRTIPDMGFFGITNGRACYCAPYYEPEAGDSSQCDQVCDGQQTTMCGGKSKSSIFAMHMCANTAADLSTTKQKLSDADGEMTAAKDEVATAASSMQSAAETWQAAFGKAGDPVAAALMQAAKEFAGELEEAVRSADKLATSSATLTSDAAAQASADFGTSDSVKKAEDLMEKMEEAMAKTLEMTELLEKGYSTIKPELTEVEKASSKYFPVMYFVDKEFEKAPSTCGGTAAERPMVGTVDECARACDADVHECVGFSHFSGQGTPMCFLFSKLKTATYYAKCDAPAPPASFLQRTTTNPPPAAGVQCLVKFSEFEGTTLKPNPSGKCDQCLKEATKADRCFQ